MKSALAMPGLVVKSFFHLDNNIQLTSFFHKFATYIHSHSNVEFSLSCDKQ